MIALHTSSSTGENLEDYLHMHVQESLITTELLSSTAYPEDPISTAWTRVFNNDTVKR